MQLDTPPDPAEPRTDGDASLVDPVPTSFGVFKPVGWVMMGLPGQPQTDALQAALGGRGWTTAQLLQFRPRESQAELEAMVDKAGAMAGFGYEITLLRRYVTLAQQGYCWLLVKVDGVDQAASAAEVARGCGATLAVHYRTLTVEDLI